MPTENPGVAWGREVSKSARRTCKIVALIQNGPALREDHIARILTAVEAHPRLTQQVSK